MRQLGRIIFHLLIIVFTLYLTYHSLLLLRRFSVRSSLRSQHKRTIFRTSNSRPYAELNLKDVKVFGTAVPQKVKLNIGLISGLNDVDVTNTINYIYKLTQHLTDDEKKELLISIAILPSSSSDQELPVVEHLRSSYKLRDLDLQIFKAPSSAKTRLLKPNAALGRYFEPKLYLEHRVRISQLLAVLLWFGSKSSQYLFLTDVTIQPKDDLAIRKLLQDVNKSQSPMTNVHQLADSDTFGLLFPNSCLKQTWNTIYWFSPYKSFATLLLYVAVSIMRDACKPIAGAQLFKRTIAVETGVRNVGNPPARVASNMIIHDQYFASNPYELGTPFWASQAPVNSTITVNFIDPQFISRVYIETGLDIMWTDSFNKAAFEVSYTGAPTLGRFADTTCGRFTVVADFSNFAVDMKDSPAFRKRISCLRIRITKTHDTWIAIRKFVVKTKN